MPRKSAAATNKQNCPMQLARLWGRFRTDSDAKSEISCDTSAARATIHVEVSPLQNKKKSLATDFVDDLRHGSHEAFAELVRLHHRDVRSFVRRHVGGGIAADELAQDVFVQAHRNITKYSECGSIRSWLLGIARHLVLTHLRTKGRKSAAQLDECLWDWKLEHLDEDPFDNERELMQLRALRQCVAGLPKDHRLIVERFYFDGMTAATIGSELGRKPGSVRMLLLRIRESLRDCVNRKVTPLD